MRGDVLQPRQPERIVVRVLAVVAHQRAVGAVRVVVLAGRKAVVEQQQQAALERRAGAADEALGGFVRFGDEVIAAGQGGQLGRDIGRIGRALGPPQAVVRIEGHAAPVPDAAAPRPQRHGHRIEHLVADHHAGEARGQRIVPPGQAGQVRAERGQGLLLALAQFARELDDAVAIRPHAERLQLGQDVGREPAGARAELQHMALAGRQRLQDLGDLVRDGAAEERRQFRCGDEVSAVFHAAAELGRAAAVVAQARRVQRQFHVALEREPAAGGLDGADDGGEQAVGLRLRGLAGKR